jgi:hypothetical protein
MSAATHPPITAEWIACAQRAAAIAIFDRLKAGRKVPLRTFLRAAEVITADADLLARYRHD